MEALSGLIPLLFVGFLILAKLGNREQKSNKRRNGAGTKPPAPKGDFTAFGNKYMEMFEKQLNELTAFSKQTGPEPGTESELTYEPVVESGIASAVGSIEYASPEGTEFHGDQHLTMPRYDYEPEQVEVSSAAVRPQLTRSSMREAVVMAEVLGRPVSMRRR